MIIDKVRLTSPTADPIIRPNFIWLTCGQDVIVPTFLGVSFLFISCRIESGSDRLTTEIKKDNVSITSSSFSVSIVSPSNDDIGTYTFEASNKACGSDVAVSRI